MSDEQILKNKLIDANGDNIIMAFHLEHFEAYEEEGRHYPERYASILRAQLHGNYATASYIFNSPPDFDTIFGCMPELWRIVRNTLIAQDSSKNIKGDKN